MTGILAIRQTGWIIGMALILLWRILLYRHALTQLAHANTELFSEHDVLLSDNVAMKPLVNSTSPVVNTARLLENGLVSSHSKSILFVHVGKAGGETIKNILRAGCESRKNKRLRQTCLARVPDTALSNAVQGYFHCFTVEPPKFSVAADAYLFNLRHPVDRAVSWYHYVHPDNCKRGISDPSSPSCLAARQLVSEASSSSSSPWVGNFFSECFSTLEKWATAASNSATTTTASVRTTATNNTSSTTSPPPPNTSAAPNCTKLALDAFAGGGMNYRVIPLAAHMIANLAHYAARTVKRFPHKPVYVVRTHALWNDLQQLDVFLGGTGNDFGNVTGSAVTHGSEHHRTTSLEGNHLSYTATATMCCHLMPDMTVYRDLVLRAANLGKEIKQQELLYLTSRCGAPSWLEFLNQCSSSPRNVSYLEV
jgi:hypothetical protein